MLVLQEEFKRNGYRDLLSDENAAINQINLDDLFDIDVKPSELIGIYISKKQDELFFIIDGGVMEINNLFEVWDNRIRVFTIVNGNNEVVQGLKYNIIQLIIYPDSLIDKSCEGNLFISRKIILKGTIDGKKQVFIEEADAIELPFYMIPINAFSPDEEQASELRRLLPKDEDVFTLLKKKRKKVNKKEHEGILDKSYKIQDFEKIKEWLET